MKTITLLVIFCSVTFSQILGPFAGGVTETSAVFILKSDNADEVFITLYKNGDESDKLISEKVQPLKENYYYSKIKISNLEPDTRYTYRAFINNKAADKIHSFKTFPKDKRKNFSFAFGSCQQAFFNISNPVIFRKIAEDTVSFFIHLGDWTYPDTTEKVLGYRFNSSMDLLEQSYQSRYDYNYPLVKDVLSTMPVMYVYDDHDFAANNSDGSDPDKHKTIEAYRKFFPHYELPNPENGIWQSFVYGDAEFFMLDLRAQRRPNDEAFDQNGKFNPQPGHSILAGYEIPGVNQKAWFLNELKNSEAKWKVIVSSVIFNSAYSKFFFNDSLVKSFGWLASLAADKWGGFPEDVKDVLNTIKENNIQNVIVISGDTHSSFIDDGANSVIPEISASNLDVINNRLNTKLRLGGLNIWNKGSYEGNGYTYGRISFFYDDKDYALLEIIDEKGEVIANHKIVAK